MTVVTILACLLSIATCTLGLAYFLLQRDYANLNQAYARKCCESAEERRDHHSEHEKLRALFASADTKRAALVDALAEMDEKRANSAAALASANRDIVQLREDSVKKADRTARIVDAVSAINLALKGELEALASIRGMLTIHESVLEKNTKNLLALTTVANEIKNK